MEQYFNIISFVVGIVSIVLAVFSLFMARSSEKQSQLLNNDTRKFLSQIKEISDKTHDLVMGEAKENSKYIRESGSQVLNTLIKNAETNIDSKTLKRK